MMLALQLTREMGLSIEQVDAITGPVMGRPKSATYRTADNRFCRKYEERIEDAHGVEIRHGIACRTGKGVWPDQASLSVPADAAGRGAGVNF